MTRYRLIAVLTFALASSASLADDFVITISEHRFSPAELEVPAGQKIKLRVINQDSTPEEFESYSLNREKIIPGNSQGIIFIGPLQPGNYDYFGEFHEDTAQGRIIAR